MYKEFFGLCSTPFDLNTDPRFLYLSPEHARARAYLDYAVYKGDSLVVITGEIGIGKSTLIHDLTDRVGKDTEVVVMHHPHKDIVEFLQAMLLAWGHTHPSNVKPELLNQIRAELEARFTWGTRTTLIVDEAQTLTREVLEEIRLLADQEIDSQKPLGIVLIGQPCLNATLAGREMEQLRQRIRLSFHLPALDEHETKGYIERRLGVSGAGRFPIFLNETIPRIYKYTGGVPRLINVLADLSLTAAWMDGQKYVSALQVNDAIKELGWVPYSRRMRHMPTLPLMANIGGQVRLANDRIGQRIYSMAKAGSLKGKHAIGSLIAEAERTKEITWRPLLNWTREHAIPGARKKIRNSRFAFQLRRRQLLLSTKESSQQFMQSLRDKSAAEGLINPSSVRGVVIGFVAAMTIGLISAPRSDVGLTVTNSGLQMSSANSAEPDAYVRPELALASLDLFSSQERFVSPLINEVVPFADRELTSPAPNLATLLKQSHTAYDSNSQSTLRVVDYSGAAMSPMLSTQFLQQGDSSDGQADAQLPGLQPKEWVLAQSPDTYIIQILATTKREVVDRFLEGGISDLDIAYYRKQRDQKEWYVLVSGVYNSYVSAKSASLNLPEQARKAKPWIRPVVDVQNDILQASAVIDSGSW